MQSGGDPHPPSEIVERHLPCPCGKSSDAYATYSDGHGYCFSCSTHYPSHHSAHQMKSQTSFSGAASQESLASLLATCRPVAIKSRGLTSATCRRFQYLTRKNLHGEFEQVAIYCDPRNGQPLAAKIRNTGKDGREKNFFTVGNFKAAGLYGQHLCAGKGGKYLTITEGEIDCLTVSQAFDNRFAVVSVPKGAAEAKKSITKNLEWISSFEKVVLCLDMDTEGRAAATECAQLLPPGKAFIAVLPEKDPSEMIAQGATGKEIQQCIYNAIPYRPDGVIDARQLTERCLAHLVSGTPWPWDFLTEWTYGRRDGEVYIWGGGTGIGKTDFAAEVIASTISGRTRSGREYQPEAFCCFSYETGASELKKSIAGKLARKRFHIPNTDEANPAWTQEELAQAMSLMDTTIWNNGGKLFINDGQGCADWDAVKERTRFLAKAEGVKHVLVDPLAALVVGAEDERKALDKLILEAALLSVELQVKVYIASHLTQPKQGPTHEEGGRVTLAQFRGSGGIVMFANFCFGLERNQQAEDQTERVKTVVRSLKDRYTNNSIGKTQATYYDIITGILDVPYSVDAIA